MAETGKKIKLCTRCESALRKRHILKRLDVNYGASIDCAICGAYRAGGLYEVAQNLNGKEPKKE